jgi:solute:Na+ symporter, SSS family
MTMDSNLAWIDWAIIAGMLVVISVVAYSTKKYTQSVADFLAANRCAGKYLLGVADGIAGLGAISIVALFEQHYKAGFCAIWWNTLLLPVGTIIAITGWVQYRYRQTRVLTMAQFMEVRYSRRFRIFAGIMGFLSGLINFGIFPAVGGRFFQYFCGLPQKYVSLGFVEIDWVFALIMLVLLTVSLAFTFMGGQIAVMVTDFLQGSFCNIAFCIIAAYLMFYHFDWSQIMEAVGGAPAEASLINPAHSGGTDNFNPTYFLIAVFGVFVNFMAWQGNQGYFASAKSPHASRMGRVIGSFRPLIQVLPIVLLALGAYTLMTHADFSQEAGQVQGVLDTIENPKLQSQQTVTVAVAHILPVGLMGIFAAVMLAAFISTHDTYLHSWGSIFIQDVVLPIRQSIRGDNKPLTPKTHLRLLRFSILGVALYIFLFSLFVPAKLDILMFFALTGTFFLGWAGWTIIGGLYWKRGNAIGAWAGAMVGLVVSIGGWYLTYYWPNCQAFLALTLGGTWERIIETHPDWAGDRFPFSPQILFFWSMVITGVVYMGASLLSGKKPFNMDRMLHRGEYAIQDDMASAVPKRGLAALKMDKKFALDDKILYLTAIGFVLLLFGVFIVVTPLFLVSPDRFSDQFWSQLWWGYCVVMLISSCVISVWLTIGGAMDLKDLFKTLKSAKRDAHDDGTVVGHQSLTDADAEADAKQE